MCSEAVIAVVIPAYKVIDHVCDVLSRIGPEVDRIYVVDDACPLGSGPLVERECSDPRVKVLYNPHNLGVGGAVVRGYNDAICEGADVVVKVDGDGQMDPALIPYLVAPILAGEADYVKGNRFFNPEDVASMPLARLFGNSALSFLAKFSTGYWNLFDPTNGYTVIHARVAELIPLAKLSPRYFFETDILFRLNSIGAVAVDLPMTAVYADEKSNLKVSRVLTEFLFRHILNSGKRIFYRYFIRDFSIATVELILGLSLFAFGSLYGAVHWIESSFSGTPATPGRVMISALPVFVGIQFLLAFFNYDIAAVSKRALHTSLSLRRRISTRLQSTPRHDKSSDRSTPVVERAEKL